MSRLTAFPRVALLSAAGMMGAAFACDSFDSEPVTPEADASSDAPSTSDAAVNPVDDDGGGDRRTWCERRDPSLIFCDDFDDDPANAWTREPWLPTRTQEGHAILSRARGITSLPFSLEATARAQDGGGLSQEFLTTILRGLPNKVAFSFDVLVDQLEVADGGDSEVEIARLEVDNDTIDINLRHESNVIEVFVEVNDGPAFRVDGNVPDDERFRISVELERDRKIVAGSVAGTLLFPPGISVGKLDRDVEFKFMLGASVDGKGTGAVVRFDNVVVERQ